MQMCKSSKLTWANKIAPTRSFRAARPARAVHHTVAFMKTHDSQKLIHEVTEFFADLSTKRLDRLEELCCKDIVYSDRVWSDHDLCGLPKLGKQMKGFLEAYPDYAIHVDSVLARDDSNSVAAHWTARATCSSDYHGIPPTGKRSVISGKMSAHLQRYHLCNDIRKNICILTDGMIFIFCNTTKQE